MDEVQGPSTVQSEKKKKRMGRPPVALDLKKLEMFMWQNPTLENTALFFNASSMTIERFIKKQTGLTFVEFRDKNLMQTRKALVQKAISMGLDGHPALLIFALKNMAGWSDNIHIAAQTDSVIQLKYSLDDPKIKDVGPVIEDPQMPKLTD